MTSPVPTSTLKATGSHVPLPEAINAVLDELEDCAGSVSAIRHRLRQQELPEEMEIDEEDLPHPAEQARHIVARLKSRAEAIRNAFGEKIWPNCA